MTNTITADQLVAHVAWLQGDRSRQRLSLNGADLGAVNLSSANLSRANLSGANLSRANLSGADLKEVKGLNIAIDAPQRLKEVATVALYQDALDMSEWHTCNTRHCIAGWAIHLAGEPGRLLERAMGAQVAGLLLLGVEAHQHFFDSNEDARRFLQGVIDASPSDSAVE